MVDHYKTLGVERNASQDEIKKAYRRLAAQHHPDKGGDTSTFQKIQSAYEILGDPQKRQQYDNPAPQRFHGFPGGFTFHTQGFDINSMFGQMFGQGGNPFQNNRTQLYRTQVVISMQEAYSGKEHMLHLQLPNGPKIINIDIPKGIRDGHQVRYDKVIDNATLMVEFRVMPDLRFERRDDDLLSNHPISVLDLIVGTKFDFKTISGKTVEVSVPPATQPTAQLRLAGHGMPVLNSNHYGDQIILLKPFVPTTIDTEITQSILRWKSK